MQVFTAPFNTSIYMYSVSHTGQAIHYNTIFIVMEIILKGQQVILLRYVFYLGFKSLLLHMK